MPIHFLMMSIDIYCYDITIIKMIHKKIGGKGFESKKSYKINTDPFQKPRIRRKWLKPRELSTIEEAQENEEQSINGVEWSW